MKNKINFLITLILSVFYGTVQAQNNFTFGVKAGLNMSTFSSSELDIGSRTGFMGGLSVDADFEQVPFLIETGIYYAQKGPKGEYPGAFGYRPPGGGGGTFKIDYIELPIMAKYVIEREGTIQPNLLFGPYLGFKISSKIEEGNSGGQNPINEPYISDISEHVNSLDAGLMLGLGSAIILENLNVHVQLRYGIGLTPVLKNEADNGEKNRVFTLTTGVIF